ncbi:MAG: universal stress protein [Pseudolabrys sp.]|nr:universal stress protein [Pseudolabrys sp.]MSP31843.1 universal stress protein [Pseudolabrys sp.]
MLAIRSIVHPTDFTGASANAFAHALRIALTAKSTLYILHIATAQDTSNWTSFPHVRGALTRWGLLNPNDPPEAVGSKLGVRIAKVELAPQSTIGGILTFLDKHPADLIVLSTEGREGAARWLHGSVAEKLARHAKAPTLFVPANARGFVDQARGEVYLRRVLIPVDREPGPAAAIATIMKFAHTLAGFGVEERLLHVGSNPPQVKRHTDPHHPVPVAVRRGNVVETIIEAASDWQPDLIGMPTAGHHGFLDALRGSTTERVLRQAPCPLLAVPVRS